MTIFLDLAGSLIVRASMVTVMLGLTVTMNNALFETTQQTNAAVIVWTVGDIMYADLNQTVASGFGISSPREMSFVADTGKGSGHTVTIKYLANLDTQTGLYNLSRVVDTKSVCISDNLVSVNFQYQRADGHVTTTASEVSVIRVRLVAKVSGVTQGLSTTINDFKVTPIALN